MFCVVRKCDNLTLLCLPLLVSFHRRFTVHKLIFKGIVVIRLFHSSTIRLIYMLIETTKNVSMQTALYMFFM